MSFPVTRGQTAFAGQKDGVRCALGENIAIPSRFEAFQKDKTTIVDKVQAINISSPKKPLVVEQKKSTMVDALNAKIEDVDLADLGNPLAVPTYVKEIMAYLKSTELNPIFSVPHDFLSRQPELEPQMHTVLIDWLSEVHTKFKLANESIFMAATIVNRFLASKVVPKSRLQLVGIASLLIASKFEEAYTPSVRSFVRVASGFSTKQVISMERMVLQVLDFNLSNPTSITFLRRFAKVTDMTPRDRYMAFFIAELANADIALVRHAPSEIAAGAIVLTNKIVSNEEWSPVAQKYSGYCRADLDTVVNDLKRVVHGSKVCRCIVKKYAADRYYRVSTLISV